MRSFVHSVYKAASEAVLPVKSKSSFKEDGVSAGSGPELPVARARELGLPAARPWHADDHPWWTPNVEQGAACRI